MHWSLPASWLMAGKIRNRPKPINFEKNPGMAEAIPGKFGGGRETDYRLIRTSSSSISSAVLIILALAE